MADVRPGEYMGGDGRPLNFDFYAPVGEDRRPLVIAIHGGGWISGERRDNEGFAHWLADDLGYPVASIDYRLAPLHVFPAAVQDVQLAVRHFRETAEEWNIDADAIATFGHSAGGHLSLMAALCDEMFGLPPNQHSHRPNAAIATAAITDITRPAETQYEVSMSFIEQFMDRPYQGNEDAWKAASPLHFVQAGAPPILLVHGTADSIVPDDQSEAIHQALLAVGADSAYHPMEGEEHSFTMEAWEHVQDLIRDFLAAKLPIA